jgi:LPS export ABC transporter protein LptC
MQIFPCQCAHDNRLHRDSGYGQKISWVIAIAVILSGCTSNGKQASKPTPTPSAIEAKLELNDLSLEQVDRQGKLLWKVRAQKGLYTPDRKTAKVTNLSGDLYQDGKVVLRLSAKSGEVQQDGEKVILRGDVVTQETRNNLVLSGQELEWRPKQDLLTISNNVRANHPQLQAQADLGRYQSRTQRMDLTGKKIVAIAQNPKAILQTEKLTWLVKEQKVIGDRPLQVQRYEGQQIIAQVTANTATAALDRKVVNLQGNVQFRQVNPPVTANGESVAWDLGAEKITADRPLQIVHLQEGATFNADRGELDLKGQIATLSGNARGVATQNQTNLRADRLEWQMNSQQVIATGHVVYNQANPQVQFFGVRGVGKLQDQSVVVTGNSSRRVKTVIIPE